MRSKKRQGVFKTLNDGASASSLREGECPVLRNVEHPRAKSVRKRRGTEVRAALQSAAEPFCAPVVEAVEDAESTLPAGTYWVRITYGTAAGETDDLRSSDPENPGPAEAQVVVASGEAIDVSVPFALRKVAISDVQTWCSDSDGNVGTGLGDPPIPDPDCPGETVPIVEDPPVDLDECECITCFDIDPPFVDLCDDSILVGWPVFSRSPRVQDSTGLGFNCGGDEALYNRRYPLGTVVDYDAGRLCITGKHRLGSLPSDLLVDVLMPDRGGLPIRHYNVYLSTDGVDFRLAGTGISGSTPLRVLSFDPDAARAPSGRVDRAAPVVSAVDLTDAEPGLSCGTRSVQSGLQGGVYRVWVTWVTCSDTILGDPGRVAAGALLGACDPAPPLRAPQETWPTHSAVACIDTGQGIQVEVGALPDGVESFNVYTEEMDPVDVRDWAEATRNPDQTDGGAPVPRPIAFYSGDSDSSAADLRPQLTQEVVRDTAPMLARNVPWDEFANTSTIQVSGLDPFDPATRGFRPGYDDVRKVYDADGWELFLYASTRDDLPNSRQHYWMYYDPVVDADLLADSTHFVVDLRMRWRVGSFGDFQASADRFGIVRVWNDETEEWEILEDGYGSQSTFPISAGLACGAGQGPDFDHFRYCGGWDPDKLLTYVDETVHEFPPHPVYRHFVVDVYALNGIGFDVDDIEIRLYQEEDDFDRLPGPGATLQLEHQTETTVTIQNPKVRGASCGGHQEGPFRLLRTNTTAQWPVRVASHSLVGVGESSDRYRELAGVADSLFLVGRNGNLERIYQEEGGRWGTVVRNDWWFGESQNRSFITNPGTVTGMLRFDGQATYKMGLPIPSKTGEVLDDLGNYLAPSVDPLDPLAGSVDDPYLGEEELGTVLGINQIDEPGDPLPAGYLAWKVDYYVRLKRVVRACSSSYVIKSAPRLVVKDVGVRGDDDQAPALVLKFPLCPEAQVTHVELYRTPIGGQPDEAQLVRTWDLSEGNVDIDEGTGDIEFLYDDTLSLTDEDLTIRIDFNTGRPVHGRFMLEDQGRVWIAKGDLVYYTNRVSGSGLFDPEGMYPGNYLEIPVKDSAGITCLSKYAGSLLAHNSAGIASIRQVGKYQFSIDEFAAGAGAAGPDAWTNLDQVQPIFTIHGPATLFGGEIGYKGGPIEGTLARANLDRDVSYRSSCIDYRWTGGHQVWFTFGTDACGMMDEALIYDDEVNSRGDRTQHWAQWDHLPAHGLCLSRGLDGVEYPLMGGNDGRVYRFGRSYTDAGVFIDAEMLSSPRDESGADMAVQPQESTWTVEGRPPDAIWVELLLDASRDQDVARALVELAKDAKGRRWGDGMWSDPRHPITVHATEFWKRVLRHRGTANALQWRVSQTMALLPAGHPLEATFDIDDLTLRWKQYGRRRTSRRLR